MKLYQIWNHDPVLWSEILDSGAPINAIYLDFRKAFDTVPHHRLTRKLKAYGVTGKPLIWIRYFLTGCKQRVVVNGKLSTWADILSGIPQGSVLGPILFINDLPDVVRSTVKFFFADNREKLQQDLDHLMEWFQKWQLGFNEAKM